jgi:NADH dehydrogenase/NADH:ubiquinone oxidoreductase subunit G
MAAVVKLGLAQADSRIRASDLNDFASASGVRTDDFLDAAYLLTSDAQPVIVYGNGDELPVLLELADLVNAKLISIKGNANSLAASQYHLDKPLKVDRHKAAFFAVGDDKVPHKLLQEFTDLPFKVVITTYSSKLTGIADVVLPSTSWLEQEGHYINLEGKIQEAKNALAPADNTWTILEVINALSEKMGFTLDIDWKRDINIRNSPVEISE